MAKKRSSFILLLVVMVSVGLGLKGAQPPQPSPFVERGTIIYQTDKGQKLGEEPFSLVQLSTSEIQLISNTTLTSGGKTFRWSSHLRLSNDWRPLSYVLDALTPQGRIVALTEVKSNQIISHLQREGQLQSKTITVEKEPFIKDNNVNSHFAVLYRLWLAQGKPVSLERTAIVPQSIAGTLMKVEHKGVATLNAEGKEFKAEMLVVTIERARFEVFTDTRGLLGFAIAGQAIPFGYLQEYFPNGFTIVRR